MRVARGACLLLALAGAALAACGDDPFGVEDALGVWDLKEINGLAVSGTSPLGAWIREAGGTDSTQVVLESIVLEFRAAPDCRWTFNDGINSAVVDDACEYAITPAGELTLTAGTFSLQGAPARTSMMLRDADTNELWFAKRS